MKFIDYYVCEPFHGSLNRYALLFDTEHIGVQTIYVPDMDQETIIRAAIELTQKEHYIMRMNVEIRQELIKDVFN